MEPIGHGVVTQMQRPDGQVRQQVLVVLGELVGGGEGLLQCAGGVGPVPAYDVVQADQQLGEASVAGRRLSRRCGDEVGGGDSDRGVGAEGGQGGTEHAHLPGTRRIVRCNVARALQDHPVTELDRPGVPLDPRPQPDDVGAQQRVGHLTTGRVGQGACPLGASGQPCSAGGAVEPKRPGVGVHGELGGAFPRGRGSLVTPAPLGPFGGLVELGQHGLVGLFHRGGAMPRASVGVVGVHHHLGQRGMGLPSLHAGRGRVHRRAHWPT
ncbi:MAG: hypothetical protein ACRDOY_12270 [Nocardioidaceae bacterium]